MWRTVLLGVVAVAAGIVASASGGPASAGGLQVAAGRVQPTAASLLADSGAGASAIVDDHGSLPFTPPQALDALTQGQLDGQLARARAAALRYPTAADAVRAGFVEATGYVPGVGAHFMKYSAISGSFDVDHPAMILYDGVAPTSRVAGLAYYVISGTSPPDGFAGPNDGWHQHPAVCVTPKGPVLAGDAPETCRLGGRPAWMLHAWVAPSYPSALGYFSPVNLSIGTLPNLPYRSYNCHIKA